MLRPTQREEKLRRISQMQQEPCHRPFDPSVSVEPQERSSIDSLQLLRRQPALSLRLVSPLPPTLLQSPLQSDVD